MWSSLNVPGCISVLTCLLCTCIGLKPFEADMKASMLKIAEGTDEEVKSRFKENVADEDFDFDFLEPSSTARALAALEADAKLKAARHRLVR